MSTTSEEFKRQQAAAQSEGFVMEELSDSEDEQEAAGSAKPAGRARAKDTSASRAAGTEKPEQRGSTTSAPTSGEAAPRAEAAGKASSQATVKDSEFVVETFDPHALNADAPEFIPTSMQDQDAICEDYYDEVNHIVYHAAGGYTFFDFNYGQWVYVSPESMALSQQQQQQADHDEEDELHMDEIDLALDELLRQKEEELAKQEQDLDEEDERVRQFEAALEKDGLL